MTEYWNSKSISNHIYILYEVFISVLISIFRFHLTVILRVLSILTNYLFTSLSVSRLLFVCTKAWLFISLFVCLLFCYLFVCVLVLFWCLCFSRLKRLIQEQNINIFIYLWIYLCFIYLFIFGSLSFLCCCILSTIPWLLVLTFSLLTNILI